MRLAMGMAVRAFEEASRSIPACATVTNFSHSLATISDEKGFFAEQNMAVERVYS